MTTLDNAALGEALGMKQFSNFDKVSEAMLLSQAFLEYLRCHQCAQFFHNYYVPAKYLQ